jgi:hypothetical protein
MDTAGLGAIRLGLGEAPGLLDAYLDRADSQAWIAQVVGWLAGKVPPMWGVFGGAVLVSAGIAEFIEAHSHRPVGLVVEVSEGRVRYPAPGLSHTAYDLLRISAWALVIYGGLLVIVGLIGYLRGRIGTT